MGIHDVPDSYVCLLHPRAVGMHIRQISRAMHVTTTKYADLLLNDCAQYLVLMEF